MADITWANVIALDAAFTSTPAGQQTFILALVIAELSPTVWGDLLNIGQTLLAAHYATDLDGASSGAVGTVLSEKVGEVSRTYSDVSAGGGDDDDLTTTFYGAQYLRLMKTLPLARFGISS